MLNATHKSRLSPTVVDDKTEIVEKLTYLRREITRDGKEDAEIRTRILLKNTAYFTLLYILKAKNVFHGNKMRIYKTIYSSTCKM